MQGDCLINYYLARFLTIVFIAIAKLINPYFEENQAYLQVIDREFINGLITPGRLTEKYVRKN